MTMRTVQILLLFGLFAIATAQHHSYHGRRGTHRGYQPSGRHPGWGAPHRGNQHRPQTPTRSCGGHRQACCGGSQCGSGLRCLHDGDSYWVGMKKRCMRPKQRGKCGLEGLQCCRGQCVNGQKCAKGIMCRKPQDEIRMEPKTTPAPGVQGQTTAQVSGWLKVIVIGRGGKCYTRVKGNVNTSVETFGDGTFGETFGSLSGMGECTANANGIAIGYIRADVVATATLGEDGECTAESTGEILSGTRTKGQGVSVGVGGSAGAGAGCNKRRMLRELLN